MISSKRLFGKRISFKYMIRSLSNKQIEIEKSRVSPYLQYREVLTVPDNGDTKQTPLILFFPWLRAPAKALDRYCDLYHQRGWDVLTIHGDAKHFLWPKNATTVVHDLLNYLKTDEKVTSKKSFLVHGMSVGAYLYTVFLMEISRNKEQYWPIREKIEGQVFDSIVLGGLRKMGTGIAESATSNPALHTLIRTSIATYFALTKKHTVDFYEESIDFFNNEQVKKPTLFMYSLNDPMCCPEAMDKLLRAWRADPDMMNYVHYKCWEKSAHAGHIRLHPHNYTRAIHHFLEAAGYHTIYNTKSNL